MRYLLAVGMLAAASSEASAMGPSLTDFPAARTVEACRQWSAAQDEDAATIWGLLISGKSSDEVAKMRLTLYCLGDDAPGVISVGTSIGAAKAYCKTHSRQPVCSNVR